MENEEILAEEEPWSADFDPLEAFAEVDGAADAMADTTEAPRNIMVAVLAIISTVFALVNVVPWSVTLGIFSLLIPLGIWYYLVMRKRPKRRPVLSHSGPYMAYVVLFMLAVQGSRFWEALAWWEVGSKWLVVFAVGWFAISRMRAAAIKNRLRDANERAI